MTFNIKTVVAGVVAVSAALTISIVACKKANIDSATRPGISSVTRGISFSDWPTVSDGMLCFRDGEHLLSYMDALDSATCNTDSTATSDTLSADDVLEGIESGLGYTSWRHQWMATFDDLDANGWNALEDVPHPMFSDIILRSILNSDADVKVGDSIIHYVNDKYAISLAADQPQLLTAAHGLASTATLEDLYDIDPGGFNSVIYPFEAKILNADRRLRTAKATGIPFAMQVPIATSPDYCSNRTLVQLDGIELTAVTVSGIALCVSTCEIHWGDGQITPLSGQHTYFGV